MEVLSVNTTIYVNCLIYELKYQRALVSEG